MKHNHVIRLLPEANPISLDDLGDTSRTPEAQRLLEHIIAEVSCSDVEAGDGVATERPHVRLPGWRPARRRLIAAVALAMAVTAASLSVQLPASREARPAYAATPTMLDYHPSTQSAAEFLRDLAARISTHPEQVVGSGDFWYVRTQRWALFPVMGDHGASAQVTPELTEIWFAADGSTRTLFSLRGGHDGNAQVTPGMAEIWDAAHGSSRTLLQVGAPMPSGKVRVVERDRLRAEGDLGFKPRPQRMLAIWGGNPISPAKRAKFLRALADTPGLTNEGPVIDRAGRNGHAFAFDTAQGPARVRYVVILTPDTGVMLGYERILLTGRGQADGQADQVPSQSVHGPVVVEYVTYLAAARVATTYARPSGVR
jgi:hypothetical protein